MILLLDAAAADASDRTAVVSSQGAPTYGCLRRDADRVAAGLRRRGITRFAVAEPDAGIVLRILAGAALAGAEPCQYQPDLPPRELLTQADASGHAIVVTRRSDLGKEMEVIGPNELPAAVCGSEEHAGAADALTADRPQPLLIRTTGTTGRPKAARHDWRVLSQSVAGLRPAPDQRWLLAYGPQQFAGIQVLLHVVASQATLVAPFPRQPRDGLDALLHEGVTCASATPTFWRFLLAEARSRRATLPPLQQVTLGGEASSTDLLQELRRTFPEARISQVYASTELGSITSVRDGRPGLPAHKLCSESNPTGNLRVVDGQLWVRSSSSGGGMLGYARRDGDGDDSTVPIPGASWKPTGDLVEIVDDRVLFRGRSSEVINVGGVKVHPLPVEERITALQGVVTARVYGRPNRMTGAIVAVEIVPRGGLGSADGDAIRIAVKEAVSDLPRAWQPRSVALVEAIETRGGKTVRGSAG